MTRTCAPFARVLSVAVLLFLMGARSVQAQPTDPCFTTPVQGQKLRAGGKLLAARERFVQCSRNTCPAEIVADCTRWLGEVEQALPSVVLAARDAGGHDLADVTVAIDGKAPIALGARALALDPGAHGFVFRRAESPDVEQTLILREGEKDRKVEATFGPPPAPPAAPASAPSPAPPSPASQVTTTGGARPVPLAAWVAGGVGVVALASFATFGALGVSQRASDHCDTGCSPTDKSSVDVELLVADISLGVTAVALGIAAWLYATRPTVAPIAAWLDVQRVPGGGVAVVGGRF